MPNFRDYDQEQTVYRQLVPAQLLEDDHPARIVSAVVEMLDLERVYAWYKDEGKPAYHPRIVMLCSALGMIDFKHLALDGQKIQASANFRATTSRAWWTESSPSPAR
jgi:hypothetical protein